MLSMYRIIGRKLKITNENNISVQHKLKTIFYLIGVSVMLFWLTVKDCIEKSENVQFCKYFLVVFSNFRAKIIAKISRIFHIFVLIRYIFCTKIRKKLTFSAHWLLFCAFFFAYFFYVFVHLKEVLILTLITLLVCIFTL